MYNPDPINEEMGRRRLSNEDVAELAGVNKKVVSAARNGKESVMLPSLKKVADALNLELVVKLEKKAA
jgi:transcriptional regulator with XRE-family HTH domain